MIIAAFFAFGGLLTIAGAKTAIGELSGTVSLGIAIVIWCALILWRKVHEEAAEIKKRLPPAV